VKRNLINSRRSGPGSWLVSRERTPVNRSASSCSPSRFATVGASGPVAGAAPNLRSRSHRFLAAAPAESRQGFCHSSSVPARLTAALVLTLLIAGAGCGSTLRSHLPQATTNDTAEIYLQPAFGIPQHANLAVLPFKAPPYAVDAANVVTEAYYQEILRSGGFRQVTLVRELPPAQRHLPPWQVLKDFDLVLQGEVVYVLSGTGSTPTQLQVEIRMVDVSRGTMAWYLRQQCVSRPGQEVDLIWSTVPAQPATAYQNLAIILARKFVQIINTMPENQPENRPQINPQVNPQENPPVGTNPN
jgi:hypothetical protein